MKATIALLPGDGIGPEVTAAAQAVLEEAFGQFGHRLEFRQALIGGAAIDALGDPLPADTLETCQASDAAFLGAVGGPQWAASETRPEEGLLRLRKHFGLFANLRPIPVFPPLAALAPVRAEILSGVDLLFVRELTSGLYFGPRQEQGEGANGEGERAFDTMEYSVQEVERIAHVAFRAARRRRRRVTSVDKANVLASMRLWRSTVDGVAKQYPDVHCEHMLVDAAAMHLLRTPAAFDVVLAGNLFGDILSDGASVLSGSLGLLPSASLGGERFGVYEPVHGSAPDLAGQGVANPVGAILSAAMLVRHSLGLEDLALCIETAVARALDSDRLTQDLLLHGPNSSPPLTTGEMTEAILQHLGCGVFLAV
ncbi:MAG: 3-isopropylmalate dehydrogenase [Deltaproteobacteria bacterium]|nr:3-isopropylmalate dehydrogenase [Deltaproteobacteria bacterium]